MCTSWLGCFVTAVEPYLALIAHSKLFTYIHNKLFTHCLGSLYICFNKDELKIILNLDLQHNTILDVKEAHIFVQVYKGVIYTK